MSDLIPAIIVASILGLAVVVPLLLPALIYRRRASSGVMVPPRFPPAPPLRMDCPMSEPVPTGIEALVCADIARRQQVGIAKYGTTVAANPLPLRAWLQHHYEELLDAAVYARRAIEEIDRNASTTPAT